ncbi:MAG: hypothetical protein WCX10_03880, partial [Bacteroidales bacterium]
MSFEEIVTRGSHTAFIERERAPLSEEERELREKRKKEIGKGVDILRKIKTQILEIQDSALQQSLLAEAHDFASQMANVIIEQCLEQKSVEINPSFL